MSTLEIKQSDKKVNYSIEDPIDSSENNFDKMELIPDRFLTDIEWKIDLKQRIESIKNGSTVCIPAFEALEKFRVKFQ